MVAKIFSLSASGILYALVHAVVASTLQDKCLHVVMILQKGTLRQQTGEVSYSKSQIPQVVDMVFEYRPSDSRAYTSPTPLSCHPVALCISKSCWHSKVPSDQHMADEPRALSLSRTSYKAYQGGCTHQAQLVPAHRPHCTSKISGSVSTGTFLEVKTPGWGEMFVYPGLPRTA